jgi:hypothetical protein
MVALLERATHFVARIVEPEREPLIGSGLLQVQSLAMSIPRACAHKTPFRFHDYYLLAYCPLSSDVRIPDN